MGGCTVPKCTNHSRKGISVKRCPVTPQRRAIWIEYLRTNGYNKIEEEIPVNFHICAIHFNSYYNPNTPKSRNEDPVVPKSTWIKVK